MNPITSDSVRNSKFFNTNVNDVLVLDKTVGECREMLIEIIDEYKDLLERLRDA